MNSKVSVRGRVAAKEATPEQIAAVIREQVAVVGQIELRGNFEKLKLGAMVSEAVRILRLEGAQTGRGHAGDGAAGWWNEVCPRREDGSPVIPYGTVMRWRQAAESLPALMGVGAATRGEVVALLAADPAEAVGEENAKLLSSAERLANGMSMRQMLLWGGDEAARSRRGILPGQRADLKAQSTDAATAARAVWSKVIAVANQTMPALKAGSLLLCADDVADGLATLESLKEMLVARRDELKCGRAW